MSTGRREPFVNARFRVEIDGLSSTGATEVIFPEARIVQKGKKSRAVEYGRLTLRRGMTASGDWYEWWDRARQSPTAGRRTVNVVLMDASRADVTRWVFDGAQPSGYFVSPLNALASGILIETLELSVRGLRMVFSR